MDVAGYLKAYSLAALREMAEHRGLRSRSAAKAAVISALAPLLFDPQWLREWVKTLTDKERTALFVVRDAHGYERASVLAEWLSGQDTEPSDVIRSLMAKGLLLYSPAETEKADPRTGLELWDKWRFWRSADSDLWVPPEVREVLPPAPPPAGIDPNEPPGKLEHAPEPASVQRTPFSSLARDVYVILQTLHAKPLAQTQAGDIRKAELSRLNKALAPSEPLEESWNRNRPAPTSPSTCSRVWA